MRFKSCTNLGFQIQVDVISEISYIIVPVLKALIKYGEHLRVISIGE